MFSICMKDGVWPIKFCREIMFFIFYCGQYRSAAEIERLKFELTKLHEATSKPGWEDKIHREIHFKFTWSV